MQDATHPGKNMKIQQQFRAPHPLKLDDIDPGSKLLSSGDKEQDRQHIDALSEQIASMQDIFYAERRRKLLIILQGMDASGKDGTVRGVFGKPDPLGIRCVSFRAPSVDEKEHDFLWRIHREVPPQGFMAIFNRSHYEDVLIPAVHGQITDRELKQRYQHIRDFERMLHETGTVILKFFLHISPEEQKSRLQARLDNGEKHWKVDLNDLKERKYWSNYQKYYESAIEATNTDEAPWYVIPADSKTRRNLAVASIVVEAMQAMALRYPAPNPDYFSIRVE